MTRLAELDVAAEAQRLTDQQALSAGLKAGLSVGELSELLKRRIARRAERRVVDVSVRVKCLRERTRTAREWRRKSDDGQRAQVQAHREAWRKR